MTSFSVSGKTSLWPRLAVGWHDALREACRTARVEDVGQVVGQQFVAALLHLLLMGMLLAQAQELVEVDARLVLRVLLHLRVEDDELLDVRLDLHHAQGRVVLELLAHEDEAHVGIRDHVAHLLLAARGIEGDGDGPHAIGSVVAEHTLGLVLREDGYLLLHLHTHLDEGIAYEPHLTRELVP